MPRPKKPNQTVKKDQPKHDQSYKRLFSHPKMVEDLLRGFVHEAWVEQLDFATLEVFKDSFVSDNLIERSDDIIWRLRWGDKWLYVYLLLEFQSTIDNFMAVRIMVYIGLLYQYLIDTQKMKAKDKLPPVLPLVLYNGNNRWGAAQDISELIAEVPGGLEQYRPQLRYFLIDEGKYENIELEPWHNLVAAIIRLENTRTEDDEKAIAEAISSVLELLVDWLKEPDMSQLRRDIVTWLKRVLLPKNVPNIEIPEVIELQEMKTMLSENMQNWYQRAEAKGEARGMALGKAQGITMGEARGIAMGKAQGITLGEARGIAMGKAQGITKGEAKILTHLLESKFGVLPASTLAKISSLDSDSLLKCSKRLLTEKTLDEVLKP
jgi:predicted transposase/invertase (TIGR01784 family)